MAGEGSIQAMISILRNNKSLLKHKSRFKREINTFETRKQFSQPETGQLKDLSKATPNQLSAIKTKILAHKKRQNILLTVVIICIAVLILSLFKTEIKNIVASPFQTSKTINNQQLKQYNNYLYFGDKALNAKRYNDAIFNYKKALHLQPDDFGAQYGLANAYVQQCKYQKDNCSNAKTSLEKLLQNFSNREEVKQLAVLYTTNLKQLK